MIIKTEDLELEISTEAGVYFGSKTLGQIFRKWNDLENNKKLRLEIIQKNVEKLILESKEILSEKEVADN
jgi:3-dehydroquinate dehydratase